MLTIPIEILEHLSAERFFDEFFGRRPFVIRNQLIHWPASRLWTPYYLKQRFGEASIRVSFYDSGAHLTFLDQTILFVHRTMALRDYLDTFELSSDSRFVLREDSTLFERFPEMLDDLAHFSPFCSNAGVSNGGYKSLWLGPPNYITGLHADPGDTLLFQIFGHKRALLFEPRQAEFLYEENREQVLLKADRAKSQSSIDPSYLEVLTQKVGWCEVNPFDADLERFPLFERAQCVEAFIGPGDTLYIPDKWWHAVHSRNSTISVSLEPGFDGPFFTMQPN